MRLPGKCRVSELSRAGVRVLPLNAVITFLGFLDTHLMIPIMALYAAELGASTGIAGLIIGIYSLTNTPANILFGRLMDRVGYKVPLIAGLVGDAVSMFLYSLCRLPVQLMLVRALHGTSGGLVGPATMSITADYSGRGQKGRAMSIYGMSLAMTTLVGYGVSGVVTSRFGFGALFLLGAAVLGVAVLLSLLLPGNHKKRTQERSLPRASWAIRIGGLLRRRGLLVVAYSAIFAQYFSFGGVVTLLPLYVRGLGMGAFHVGMLLAIFAVMFIIIQFPSGSLSDRMGRRGPIIAGLALGMVSLVLLPAGTTFALLAAAMGLYGIAYGVLFPSISALVADYSRVEERGLATGLFHAVLTAGVALGAPVIGWIGGAAGLELGLRLSAVFMLPALLIALRRSPGTALAA